MSVHASRWNFNGSTIVKVGIAEMISEVLNILLMHLAGVMNYLEVHRQSRRLSDLVRNQEEVKDPVS